MLDFWEAWNNAHDPQRREPSGYCVWCGGEIYSEESLEEYNGFCETCFDEIERAERDEEEEGAVEDARERTGVPVCAK